MGNQNPDLTAMEQEIQAIKAGQAELREAVSWLVNAMYQGNGGKIPRMVEEAIKGFFD